MIRNIYLPDDLAKRLKAQPQLNVSAICQAAIRSHLLLVEHKSRSLEEQRRRVSCGSRGGW